MIEITTEVLQIIIAYTCINDCVGSLTKAHLFEPLKEYSGVIIFFSIYIAVSTDSDQLFF